MKDIANYINTKFLALGSATAGTTIDIVTSKVISSKGFNSGEISLGYTATLDTAESLLLTLSMQTSKDNSNWNTAEVLLDEYEILAVGAGAYVGEVNTKMDFASRDKYVKFNIDVDFTATGTDTASWALSTVLGGSDSIPV